MSQNHLVNTISKKGYSPPEGVKLGFVTFYGIKQGPQIVTVNGETANFSFDADLKVRFITVYQIIFFSFSP